MPINHAAQKAIYTSEKPVEVIEKRRERLQKNCGWGRQQLSRPKLLDYGVNRTLSSLAVPPKPAFNVVERCPT